MSEVPPPVGTLGRVLNWQNNLKYRIITTSYVALEPTSPDRSRRLRARRLRGVVMVTAWVG
ncbi:MAG: hypothetical protein VCB63_12155 [Alphaproteobacteria bacterium]